MEWQKIFLESKSSSEIIKNIYLFLKNKNQSYSLQYICLRSEIKSKGYLSDVMKGKRILNPKYNNGLLKTFKLRSKEKQVFELLLKIDQETNPLETPKLIKKLNALKKSYQTDTRKLSTRALSYADLIVFASFGLSKKKLLSFDEIKELCLESNRASLKNSVQNLIELGLIKKTKNSYSLTQNDVVYRGADSDSVENQVQSIESAMNYISTKLPAKIKDQKKSYFESSVLSIKKSQLEDTIAQLRNYSETLIAECEVEEGDALLHFNLQVFASHMDF